MASAPETSTCPACDAPFEGSATYCSDCEEELEAPGARPRDGDSRFGAVARVLGIGILIGCVTLGGLYGLISLREATDPHRQAVLKDMQPILDALAAHQKDVGYPPMALADLWKPGSILWDGPYLDSTETVDRWGNQYSYTTGIQGYKLTSFGAGGAGGGSGPAADVTAEQSIFSGTQLAVEGSELSLYIFKMNVSTYHQIEGRLPKSSAELIACEYVDADSLRDVWGNTPLYTVLPTGQFRVTCLGADGKVGGTGDDADSTYTSPAR